MSTVGERMGEALLAEALEMAGTHNRPFHDGIRWAALCLISGELDHLELTDHGPRETWTCTCGNSIEVPSNPRFNATNEAVAEWQQRHTGCTESTDTLCRAWNDAHDCRLSVDHVGDHRCAGCHDVWNRGPWDDDADEWVHERPDHRCIESIDSEGQR